MQVLLVEDDQSLATGLSKALRSEGFVTNHVAAGEAALHAIRVDPPDIIVLDLGLPDMDGLDVLRKIRRSGSTIPVLILTARASIDARVSGLDSGADDYLPKPFEPRELLARLRAILRRRVAGPQGGDVLRYGRLEIDRAARVVRVDGRAVELTAYQYALLLTLAEHAGRVMTRDALMDLMKGEPLEAFDRSIDVHISRIRAAIEADPKKPRRILTVRGAGYVFAKAQD